MTRIEPLRAGGSSAIGAESRGHLRTTPPAGGSLIPQRIGMAIFAGAAITTVAYLLELGRHLTFFFDEWDFISFVQTSYWHAVVQGHQGHPSMIPYTVYWLLLNTVGMTHYWPYLLVLTLLNVLCGWLLFAILRSRVNPVIAASVASVLMLLGPAWQDLIWAFQLAWLATLCAGLGALLLLERGTLRSDVGSCFCLLVSAGCSGLCVPILAGVGVQLLWHRRDWRRLWVPTVPAAIFLAWFLRWGLASSGPRVRQVGVGTALHFVVQAESVTVGALMSTGLGVSEGVAAALLLVVAFAFLVRPNQAHRLAMALAASMTLLASLVVERGAPLPYPSRYIYPGAVFAALTVGEAISLLNREQGSHMRRARHSVVPATLGAVALVAASGLVMWRNSSQLEGASAGLAGLSARIRVDLGADQLAATVLPPDFQPAPYEPQITSGWYRLASRKYGMVGLSPYQLGRQDEAARSEADSVLARGLPFKTTIATAHKAQPCINVGSLVGGSVRLSLPTGGLVVSSPQGSPTRIMASALADEPSVAVATLAPRHTERIFWPDAGRVAVHWQLWLSSAAGAGQIECGS